MSVVQNSAMVCSGTSVPGWVWMRFWTQNGISGVEDVHTFRVTAKTRRTSVKLIPGTAEVATVDVLPDVAMAPLC